MKTIELRIIRFLYEKTFIEKINWRVITGLGAAHETFITNLIYDGIDFEIEIARTGTTYLLMNLAKSEISLMTAPRDYHRFVSVGYDFDEDPYVGKLADLLRAEISDNGKFELALLKGLSK